KKNLAEVRKRRDDLKVKDALGRLHEAATRSENIIPYFIEASRTYASIEEMMKACTTAGN
ncbi:MAG: methylmalonyl-CoA mutase family protein, partial [Syntrophales bacterium]